METYSAVEVGGVTTKVTKEYVTKKTNFNLTELLTEKEKELIKSNKKLWVEGKVNSDLLKYFPVKPKKN